MHGKIAATQEGKILAVDVDVIADHGAFNATAQPTKYPAGFFHVFTGSYDLEAAHCKVTGVYTNKAPGGVAYACSFRVTEAVYLVERMVDCLASELGVDPAELRLKNLIAPEQFPYQCKTGWEYDSGDYEAALRKAMENIGYGSRSTPVSGAATALAARKVRDKARIVASAMLEVAPDDLEWEKGRWFVKGDPEQGATIQDIAMAAHGSIELPAGVEGGLDAET